MNKIEKLAKILFLFFAVISLGLVTVSCSDDDEEKCSCSSVVDSDSVNMDFPNATITKIGDKFYLHAEYNTMDFHYQICNSKKVKDYYNKGNIKVDCTIDVIGCDIDNGYVTNGHSFLGLAIVKSIKLSNR